MNGIGSPFAHVTPVVKNLLIINAIFFLATYLFGEQLMITKLGVFYFDSPNFRIWQVVSYMFMHGGFAHIFFNMFALYTFGTAVEYMFGSKQFLKYYVITGLGALALQMIVQAFEVYQLTGSITIDPQAFQSADENTIRTLSEIYYSPMVGASGAIFGILIAFGMLLPNAELFIMFIPVPVKAKYIIPLYIIIELVLGVAQFSGDSVAHFAHIGGALVGFLLLKIWGYRYNGKI